MKIHLLVALFTLVAATSEAQLRGQNSPVDTVQDKFSVATLRNRAHRLEQAVSRARLGYIVELSSERLVRDADQLNACVQQGIARPTRPIQPIPGAVLDGGLVRCAAYVSRVQNSFQVAERDIRLSLHRSPIVDAAVREVRLALNQVERELADERLGGRLLRATGRINGLPFSFAARQRQAIETQCISFGHRNRINFVGSLEINGRAEARNVDLYRACQRVAARAY